MREGEVRPLDATPRRSWHPEAPPPPPPSLPLRVQVPVFWACGVTPQAALMEAKLPLAITHAPGHMLVCDLLDAELEVRME